MSQKKRSKKPCNQLPPEEGSCRREAGATQLKLTAPKLPARKTWCYRLLAVFGVPLLVFGGIEAALQLTGVGYNPAFLVQDEPDPEKVRDNPAFGWRFFPKALSRSAQPLRIAKDKPAAVTRVLIVGGSAAMGDPEPAYGVARVLQVLLDSRFPEHRFEVINAAVTAINSHVVLPIVRDCGRLDPDAVIIYMGNNEVHGPFGSGTVFGDQAPPLWSIRSGLVLKKTKIGQVLGSIGSREGIPESWGGLEMFLQQQVSADDPKLQRVYGHFENNLKDVVDTANRDGAKVLISTVVVNLRDSAPFLSLPRDATGEWQRVMEEATAAETDHQFEQAIRLFETALALTPKHAETHFRLATCLLEIGKSDRALAAFKRARDFDALRFRADTRINAIIREAAASTGAVLVDAEQHFAAASVDGIPGKNVLWEHVHFNFDGSYLLARLFADSLTQELAIRGGNDDWPDMERVAQELGLTSLHRKNIVEKIQLRTGKAPFTGQFGHLQRQQELSRLADTLTQEMSQFARSRTIENFERLLEKHPDDWVLRQQFATLLVAIGDQEGAIAQRRKVTRILPHFASGYYELGSLLNHAKQWQEASQSLHKAVALRPDFATAINSLGIALSRSDAMDEACAQFARAIELVPDYSDAWMNWGLVLAHQGDTQAAVAKLIAATEFAPESPGPHLHLGRHYVKTGQFAKAVPPYEAVARLSPNDAAAHLNLGMLYLKIGNLAGSISELERSLELNPQFETTRQQLEAVRKLAASKKQS